MAELSLDELMMVLLEDVPLTEERGLEGPGTYSTCPVCGYALRWPEPEPAIEVQVSNRRSVRMRTVLAPAMDDFEAGLGEHLAGHDRMEIYKVLARLVEEARAGRILRRRIEAVLAG